MNNNSRKYFKDDIRRTFISYALIPITVITLIIYGTAFLIWNRTIIYQTEDKNQMMCQNLKQTVVSFMNKADEIAEDKQFYKLLYNTQEKRKAYQHLYAFTNQIEEKVDFYILDNDMRILAGSTKVVPNFIQKDSNISWGITKRMKESPTSVILECNKVYKDNLKRTQLIIGRAITDSEEVQGYILFILYGDEFIKTSGSPTTQIIVTDEYDNIFLSTTPGFNNSLDKIIPEFKLGEHYMNIERDKYYKVRRPLLNGKLWVYTFTPLGQLGVAFVGAGLFLILVILMLILVMFIVAKKIATEKTKMIDQMVIAFEEVQKGNLDVRLDIKSYDEFEVIGHSYNLMLESIKELLKVNEEKVRQTILCEIKQLESQFNPHFLFNTLEHIRYMAKLDPDAASKMIISLSTLLRYSINNKLTDVTIKEDLEYTKSYLQIQQYRFSSRFKYVTYIEKGAEKCIVPKLILQPIIENAIKYGFEDRDELTVRIKVSLLGDYLVIVIFDDGVGIEPKTLEDLQSMLEQNVNETTHIGLYNVHRRIKLMYGEDYGIDLKSERGEGTVVKIILPIHKKGESSAEGIDC